MVAYKDKDKGSVVSLNARRAVEDEANAAAFGVSITQSNLVAPAANEQAESLLGRLVFDETQAFYVASLDGALIAVSAEYEKLTVRLGNGLLSAGAPDHIGHGPVPSLKLIIDDVMANGSSVRVQESLLIGREEHVFLGRHIPVKDALGDVIAIAGVYEDITGQIRGLADASRAQSRFQDFTRASSDWFWECDDEMKLNELSDRFTAIVGRPSSLYKGSSFDQIGKFNSNNEGRNDFGEAVALKKPFRDQLLEINDASGKDMRFHLSGVPIFDRATGEFSGYRGVGMDVTQKYRDLDRSRRTRQELEDTLKELTRKNMALDIASGQAQMALKSKNEFLAAMSHELRTPLNAIIGFAGAMTAEACGELGSEYKGYANDIHGAGEHLLGLINDILDVSVIEGGGLTLQLEDLPLEVIIGQAANYNIQQAHAKNIDTSNWHTDAVIDIMADDRRATQIFVNLLSNAVKFTPEGGQIGIEIEEGEKTVNVTIWDNGIGIAPDHLDVIFDKFKQVTDHFYSRKQEGTGLGLHISRELARHMGGNISVTSEEGVGSRFTVTLPKSKQE